MMGLKVISAFKKPWFHAKSLFSSTTSKSEQDRLLRVAIIGGGASGLSTALHLAPLVEKGLIAKPIDLYEKSYLCGDSQNYSNIHQGENVHTGSGTEGRDVGVGIWNTALEPFHDHYPNLIHKLQYFGSYVGKVGYRTPNGTWLAQSSLNTSPGGMPSVTDPQRMDEPSLLFLREKDFLKCLREELDQKVEQNLIQTHFASHAEDKSTEVESILLPQNDTDGLSGSLSFSDGRASKPYHFIIAADGMNSVLRSKYGGYENLIKTMKKSESSEITELSKEWSKKQIEDAHALVDRNYTVFRGSSCMDESHENWSWQTWGEGDNMRFACVSMSIPSLDKNAPRIKQQVWFATCDRSLNSIDDMIERKSQLVEKFQSWHDPIAKLIESTPAESILVDSGVAHKHSLFPVLRAGEVLRYKHVMEGTEMEESITASSSPGPILLFTGDAAMTVDPVLAQGFTIAMEAAADLSLTMEKILTNRQGSGVASFVPDELRSALSERSQRRYGRMLCLLRSTELVQTMAQPSNSFSCFVSKYIVRPSMIMIPSFLKEMAFSRIMKYSLGYFGDFSLYNKSRPRDDHE